MEQALNSADSEHVAGAVSRVKAYLHSIAYSFKPYKGLQLSFVT